MQRSTRVVYLPAVLRALPVLALAAVVTVSWVPFAALPRDAASARRSPETPSAASASRTAEQRTGTVRAALAGSAGPSDLAAPSVITPAERRADEIESLLRAMSTEEQVGQLVIAGFSGTTPDAGARSLVQRLRLGGVLLMGPNIRNPRQVRSLTAALQRASPRVPLLVAVDHEGGRVLRFRPPVSDLPDARTVGTAGDARLAAAAGRVAGRELLAMGVNFNLAPVLDVNDNPRNPVIGRRAFGTRPEVVARLGVAYMKAMQAEGVVASAKHFPGHGHTSEDSHRTLPVVLRSRQQLEAIDLAPFRAAIRAGISTVMTAHVLYPSLDPRSPATLSRSVLTDLLRRDLGFHGVVITDSLGMGAISARQSPGEGAVRALLAGSDVVLVAGGGDKVHAALLAAVRSGRIPRHRLEQSVRRVLALKLQFRDRWDSPPALSGVGSRENQEIVREIRRRAVGRTA